MAFVNIHDNSINEDVRKRHYSDWLVRKGMDRAAANIQAFQRITWIIANDESLPEGKRRQAWVKFYMSRGESEPMAKMKACWRMNQVT